MSTEAINTYLKRLGYPGNWSQADEAIRELKAQGFPVTAATEQMIRMFGGLDTYRNRPPPASPGPDVEHGPAAIQIDPTIWESGAAEDMEQESGLKGLCPVGMDYDIVGVLCMDLTGRLLSCVGDYYEGTPLEIIHKMLDGRPSGDW
jgi:hypothetical protein